MSCSISTAELIPSSSSSSSCSSPHTSIGNVMFLDVDGVLNRLPLWPMAQRVETETETETENEDGKQSGVADYLEEDFCDSAMLALQKIVSECKLDVVLSSTWRCDAVSLQMIGDALKELNILPASGFLSTTPDLRGLASRAEEIALWLRCNVDRQCDSFNDNEWDDWTCSLGQHLPDKYRRRLLRLVRHYEKSAGSDHLNYPLRGFVIVDDSDILAEQSLHIRTLLQGKFIQTNPRVALTHALAVQIIHAFQQPQRLTATHTQSAVATQPNGNGRLLTFDRNFFLKTQSEDEEGEGEQEEEQCSLEDDDEGAGTVKNADLCVTNLSAEWWKMLKANQSTRMIQAEDEDSLSEEGEEEKDEKNDNTSPIIIPAFEKKQDDDESDDEQLQDLTNHVDARDISRSLQER